VVALPWKWLFIYPEQNMASLNYLEIPVNTTIDFNITSDAPMNSFWIPRLGGQIYAMAGMNTHLHLMADQPGDYEGVSANISGDGFAGMHFAVKAVASSNFSNWLATTGSSSHQLSQTVYDQLAQPSQNDPVIYYSSVGPNIYDKVLLKYTVPSAALVGADLNHVELEQHSHE
jgi:cytochrome o ubiquinol oxidase subunit 2